MDFWRGLGGEGCLAGWDGEEGEGGMMLGVEIRVIFGGVKI